MEQTKKVVVNRCYGGFGISAFGEQEYLKRAGKECYFYHQTQYSFRNGVNKYEKISLEEINSKSISFHNTTFKDLGESFEEWPEGMDDYYFMDSNVSREDSILIQLIEEYGSEKISKQHTAKLTITEIPDDVEYEIEEYDGFERVSEVHRKW